MIQHNFSRAAHNNRTFWRFSGCRALDIVITAFVIPITASLQSHTICRPCALYIAAGKHNCSGKFDDPENNSLRLGRECRQA